MRRILASVIVCWLAACTASVGRDFEESRLDQLEKGTTTYSEALQILGPPASMSRSLDGSMIAIYHYSHIERPVAASMVGMLPIVGTALGAAMRRSAEPNGTQKLAMVVFDSKGVLRNWTSAQSDLSDTTASVLASISPVPGVTAPVPLPPSISESSVNNASATIKSAIDSSAELTTGATPSVSPPIPATQEEGHNGRRIALVIGNDRYRSLGQLRNSMNDADLMAQTLRQLGYTLIGGGPQINLDRQRFERAVRDFGHSVSGAAVAVFYYAGHGLQVDGTNWLVPVDAELTPRKQDLPFQMISADNVLLQMDGAGTQLNLLILDACRNNPIASRGLRDAQSGLAQMRAPAGTMIAYATQPGNVALDGEGANGPYSVALSHAMREPDLDIFHVFNRTGLEVQRVTGGAQVPWTSNSPIRSDISLGSAAGANTLPK